MAWIQKDGTRYYRISRVIGKKINENGVEVPVRKEFSALTKKEAVKKYEDYIEQRSTEVDNANIYFGIIANDCCH